MRQVIVKLNNQQVYVHFDNDVFQYEQDEQGNVDLLKKIALACSQCAAVKGGFSVISYDASSVNPVAKPYSMTDLYVFYITRIYKNQDGKYRAILTSENGTHEVLFNIENIKLDSTLIEENKLTDGTFIKVSEQTQFATLPGRLLSALSAKRDGDGEVNKRHLSISDLIKEIPGKQQSIALDREERAKKAAADRKKIEKERIAQSVEVIFGSSQPPKPIVQAVLTTPPPRVITEKRINTIIENKPDESPVSDEVKIRSGIDVLATAKKTARAEEEAKKEIENIYSEMKSIADALFTEKKSRDQLRSFKIEAELRGVIAQYEKVKKSAPDDKESIIKLINETLVPNQQNLLRILNNQNYGNAIALEAYLVQVVFAIAYNAANFIYAKKWEVSKTADERHVFFGRMNHLFEGFYEVDLDCSGSVVPFEEICRDNLKNLTLSDLINKLDDIKFDLAVNNNEDDEHVLKLQDKLHHALLGLNQLGGLNKNLAAVLGLKVESVQMITVANRDVGELKPSASIKLLVERAKEERAAQGVVPDVLKTISAVEEHVQPASQIKNMELGKCHEALKQLKGEYDTKFAEQEAAARENERQQALRKRKIEDEVKKVDAKRAEISVIRIEIGGLHEEILIAACDKKIKNLDTFLSKDHVNEEYRARISQQKEKLVALKNAPEVIDEIKKQVDECSVGYNACMKMIASLQKGVEVSELSEKLDGHLKAAQDARDAAKKIINDQLSDVAKETDELNKELALLEEFDIASKKIVAVAVPVPDVIKFSGDLSLNKINDEYAGQLKSFEEIESKIEGLSIIQQKKAEIKKIKETVEENKLQAKQAVLAHAVVRVMQFIYQHVRDVNFVNGKEAWKKVGFLQLLEVAVEKFDGKWINDNKQASVMLQTLCTHASGLVRTTEDQVDDETGCNFHGTKGLIILLDGWFLNDVITDDIGIQNALVELSNVCQSVHSAYQMQQTNKRVDGKDRAMPDFHKMTEEHFTLLKDWYQNNRNVSNAVKLKDDARDLKGDVERAAEKASQAQKDILEAVEAAQDAKKLAKNVMRQSREVGSEMLDQEMQIAKGHADTVMQQVAIAQKAIQNVEDAAKTIKDAQARVEEQKKAQLHLGESPTKQGAADAVQETEATINNAEDIVNAAADVMGKHKQTVSKLEGYATELLRGFSALMPEQDEQEQQDIVVDQPSQPSQPVPAEAPKQKSGVLDFIANNWHWMLLGAVVAVAVVVATIFTYGAAVPAMAAAAAALGVPAGIMATAAGAAIFGAAAALAGAACALVVSGICSGVKALFGKKQDTQPATQSMIAEPGNSQPSMSVVGQTVVLGSSSKLIQAMPANPITIPGATADSGTKGGKPVSSIGSSCSAGSSCSLPGASSAKTLSKFGVNAVIKAGADQGNDPLPRPTVGNVI